MSLKRNGEMAHCISLSSNPQSQCEKLGMTVVFIPVNTSVLGHTVKTSDRSNTGEMLAAGLAIGLVRDPVSSD